MLIHQPIDSLRRTISRIVIDEYDFPTAIRHDSHKLREERLDVVSLFKCWDDYAVTRRSPFLLRRRKCLEIVHLYRR